MRASRPTTPPDIALSRGAVATLALAAGLLAVHGAATAAEVRLRGDATFRVPADPVLAALPADGPLRAEDLRSGSLAFEITYDDATPDAEPDPYAGRYAGAIRGFRVRIGNAWIDLPASGAQLLVSDGGFGMAYRESVQLIGSARHGAFVLRAGWVQINQASTAADLRGAPGALDGDRLPAAQALIDFRSSGEYDRAFFVRLDPEGDSRRPLLWLSTSSLRVVAAPAAASATAR
jgi:hypothetical protein